LPHGDDPKRSRRFLGTELMPLDRTVADRLDQTSADDTAKSVAVRFEKVSRHFGSVRAVDGVDLEIREGEFFAMLGPSGSGKTTCLRLLAGFEQPDRGHIEIFGEAVEGVPSYRRNVNTVFQDYALFPHMTVLDNVAYALRVRGMGRRERHGKARQALALVQLEGYDDRRPAQLSGGQRQRVALARALVGEPRVLLLDEPLGALDLKLREQMQVELKELQQRLGITFVFVTHDQSEALSMSDRLAVFNDGRIMQVGTPEEIYDRPRNRFVAGFVGASNVLESDVAEALCGRSGLCSLRPERISLVTGGQPAGAGGIEVQGRVVSQQFHGATRRLAVAVAGTTLLVSLSSAQVQPPRAGEEVRLAWPLDAMHAMDEG
jgi:putative spermidine/putrescine transport system ATP-binding protein